LRAESPSLPCSRRQLALPDEFDEVFVLK
jgi:hypothetical protein